MVNNDVDWEDRSQQARRVCVVCVSQCVHVHVDAMDGRWVERSPAFLSRPPQTELRSVGYP